MLPFSHCNFAHFRHSTCNEGQFVQQKKERIVTTVVLPPAKQFTTEISVSAPVAYSFPRAARSWQKQWKRSSIQRDNEMWCRTILTAVAITCTFTSEIIVHSQGPQTVVQIKGSNNKSLKLYVQTSLRVKLLPIC